MLLKSATSILPKSITNDGEMSRPRAGQEVGSVTHGLAGVGPRSGRRDVGQTQRRLVRHAELGTAGDSEKLI